MDTLTDKLKKNIITRSIDIIIRLMKKITESISGIVLFNILRIVILVKLTFLPLQIMLKLHH